MNRIFSQIPAAGAGSAGFHPRRQPLPHQTDSLRCGSGLRHSSPVALCLNQPAARSSYSSSELLGGVAVELTAM